jgi:C1A family cysteine protease
MTDRINQLRATLTAANASWQASETSLSQLPALQKRMRLGYIPTDRETSLEAREQSAKINLELLRSSMAKGAVTTAPVAFDLRTGGYVTPIRDQSSCGSCVAFGTIATIEATYQFQTDKPNSGIDLSEAQLFYCYASQQGSTCGTGWWVTPALDAFAVSDGVADEACFPYTPGDQACSLCADWKSQAVKITGYHEISSLPEMKEWLSTQGALVACFTVYDDFYYYNSGVYHHVSGEVVGGHCVSIVGYDDDAGCWICKNSWGEFWGESGYFRIGYGECGIDYTMWAADAVVMPTPTVSIAPVYEYRVTNPWRYQYSTNPDIKDGWVRTGVAFFAFGANQSGVVPVYQCHATHPWRYQYSRQGCTGADWTNDGTAFYAYATQVEGTIPVYQYVATAPWRYQYSTDSNVGNGWTNEGVAFYVFAAKSAA